VPVWLNASDALLLTSMHEGSPTVVRKRWRAGLPVVSVDVVTWLSESKALKAVIWRGPSRPNWRKTLPVRAQGKRLNARTRPRGAFHPDAA